MGDPKVNGNGKSDGNRPPFKSSLTQGRQRFLSYVIEQSLDIGRRSSADFIRHFPPEAIMKGLEHQASIRAGILVLTTGLRQKIAIKKTWHSAAEDLQISLDEGETDAESIVAVFKPDDRVRYLDPKKLWAYLIEGEFWRASPSKKPEFDRAKAHVAFMIDRALVDGLITHRDVVEGVTVTELAQRLPKQELGRLIERALGNASKNTPFTETDLFETLTAATLVEHVPLDHIWDKLIVPKIADAHGYSGGRGADANAAEAVSARPPSEDARVELREHAGQNEVPAADAAQPPPPPRGPSAPTDPEKWIEGPESATSGDEALTVSDDDIRID
jgi:hypothetical protein